MALSDVMLQNYMPRNILESDDETDTWSNGGRSSCSSSQSSESGGSTNSMKDSLPTGFSLFQDYFGLSNLLTNVKISDDNPLLYTTQKNLALLQRARRQSWGSDGSDNAAVLSPTMESQYNFERNFDANNNNSNTEPGMKPLPPPSMRLSKAMRDHIISGAYQQQVESRNGEKFPVKQPLVMPPSPPALPNPPPPPPPVLNLPPPPPQAAMQRNSQQQQQPGVQVCVFCRNNGESESVYTSHVLKDTDGRTACPILRAYTCPICKANGDNSHTIKYCPMNQNARMSGVMNQQHNQPPVGGFVPRNHQMPPRPNGFRPPFPPPNLPGNHQHHPRLNHNQHHNNNGPHNNSGKMRP